MVQPSRRLSTRERPTFQPPGRFLSAGHRWVTEYPVGRALRIKSGGAHVPDLTLRSRKVPASLLHNKMKFLGHIRSKTRLKSADDTKINHQRLQKRNHLHHLTNSNPTTTFPASLLEKLLSYVCPHSQDDTYRSCEESMVDGGCMLCDMRDLAQCALVNQQWSRAAQNLL